MGWTYPHNATIEKVEAMAIDDLGQGLIDYERVGRVLWCLCEVQTGEHKGKKLAVCCLLTDDSGNPGLKIIDETMGPYYHNIPAAFFIRLDEPLNKYAEEWRERVRQA